MDAQRIGIMGFSAGGHLAACAAALAGDRGRSARILEGPADATRVEELFSHLGERLPVMRREDLLVVSAAMRDMASFGHSSAIADWRTTNLEASRFWPAQGFLTIANRYVRTVPDRPADG